MMGIFVFAISNSMYFRLKTKKHTKRKEKKKYQRCLLVYKNHKCKVHLHEHKMFRISNGHKILTLIMRYIGASNCDNLAFIC